MNNSLEEKLKYFLERLRQLENLPNDSPIKQRWKSGEISDEFAIYLLELDECLKE